MAITDDGLLEVNATVIAGVLIFLTITSTITPSSGPLTPSYSAILIIFPFALSSIVLLRVKGEDRPDSIRAWRFAKIYSTAGFVTLMVVISMIGIFSFTSQFDSTAVECAKDPRKYNITHPYDCVKFSPGSIAEHCAHMPKTYGLNKSSDCSIFISPT